MAIEVGNKCSSLSVTNELKQIKKLFASLQIVTGDTWATARYLPILVHVNSDDILSSPYAKGFKDEK